MSDWNGVWLNRETLDEAVKAMDEMKDSFEWYCLNDKTRDCYDEYDLMIVEKWDALEAAADKLRKKRAEA